MKKMIAPLFLTLSLIFGTAHAQASLPFINELEASLAVEVSSRGIINWKIGDTNEYNLDMGFLKGTMTMKVAKEDAVGFWLEQIIDLKVQKQTAEVLIDKNNGKIVKIVVNGKEQAPPQSDLEVIDTQTTTITVPAGTFDVMYVKLRDKAQNNSISEVWANPNLIPISGMAKTIQPNQMGKVKLELTKFHSMP